MQPSEQFIDFIKAEEGFSAHAYLDPHGNTRGLYSIGYGHQIQPNERHLITSIITKAQATAMLENDLKYRIAQTNRYFKRPATQGLFDAILDLNYNAGEVPAEHVATTWNTTGSKADTVAHLAQFHYETVAPGVHRINPDLVKRRAKEANWIDGVEGTIEKKST